MREVSTAIKGHRQTPRDAPAQHPWSCSFWITATEAELNVALKGLRCT